jgi:hypothetical protein
MKFHKKLLISLLLAMLTGLAESHAQQPDSSHQNQPADSTKQNFAENVRKAGTAEALRSIQLYEKRLLEKRQRVALDLIGKNTQQLRIFLKLGIDTPSLGKELQYTKSGLEIVKDGVFINKGSAQTQ